MALFNLTDNLDKPASVTLPKFDLPPVDDDAELHEAAKRVAQQKIIRLGRDAWHLVGKAKSFENWKLIGQALRIGQGIAVRATGARTGKHYAKAFYTWADQHGFTGMTKSDRWSAVDLVENLSAIETWRATLPERERRRLINPLSNCRKWRRSLTPRPEADAIRTAEAALNRFIVLLKALSPEHQIEIHRQASEALCAISQPA